MKDILYSLTIGTAFLLSQLTLLAPPVPVVITSGHRVEAGGGSAPAYVGEHGTYAVTENSTTSTFSPSTTIPAGSRAVMVFYFLSEGDSVTGIADDTSNPSWSIDKQYARNGETVVIASVHCTDEITNADTVTVTWDGAAFYQRGGVFLELSDVATSSHVDVTAQGGAFSTDVDASASVTATPTVIVGITQIDGTTQTMSNYTYSETASSPHTLTKRLFYFAGAETGTGTINSEGDLSATTAWTTIWVAYKG